MEGERRASRRYTTEEQPRTTHGHQWQRTSHHTAVRTHRLSATFEATRYEDKEAVHRQIVCPPCSTAHACCLLRSLGTDVLCRGCREEEDVFNKVFRVGFFKCLGFHSVVSLLVIISPVVDYSLRLNHFDRCSWGYLIPSTPPRTDADSSDTRDMFVCIITHHKTWRRKKREKEATRSRRHLDTSAMDTIGAAPQDHEHRHINILRRCSKGVHASPVWSEWCINSGRLERWSPLIALQSSTRGVAVTRRNGIDAPTLPATPDQRAGILGSDKNGIVLLQ